MVDDIKCEMYDKGYELVEPQPDPIYLRFKKDDEIVDIWYTTGTRRFIKNGKTRYEKASL